MKVSNLNKKLTQALVEDDYSPIVKSLWNLVTLMNDAEDGNYSISSGNIGVNITCNAIDVVDIESGTSIGTFILQ